MFVWLWLLFHVTAMSGIQTTCCYIWLGFIEFWFDVDNYMLGLVSGGRGTLGECGGVNNPIHYVRYVLTILALEGMS